MENKHHLFCCLGLNDEDQYGNKLVERQVPWVVPARLCHELQDKTVADDDDAPVEKPSEVSISHTHPCGLPQERIINFYTEEVAL